MKLRRDEVRVELLNLKRSEKLRMSARLLEDHGSKRFSLPKKIWEKFGRAIDFLSWEVEFKPHPSGSVFLSEIVYRPRLKEREGEK